MIELSIMRRLIRLWRYHRRQVGFCVFCGVPCAVREEVRTVNAKNQPTSWNCLDEECIATRYGGTQPRVDFPPPLYYIVVPSGKQRYLPNTAIRRP